MAHSTAPRARQALATEVQGIQSQLLNLANLFYQGNFVFAGTATQAAPYVLDSSSPSGVTYVGNSNVNHVLVGNHLSVQSNLPGSELFSGNGTDMFQAIQDLITNLQSGTNIDTAVSEVSSAYAQINAQRVFYGNTVNQLDAQQTFLNGETTQLAQQQSTIGGGGPVQSHYRPGECADFTTSNARSGGSTRQTNLFTSIK